MLSGAITANAVEINTFSDELKVYVDNTDVYANSENKPLIINDRTVVPLRPIFEALGIDGENIKWYPEESKAIFADGNAECTFVNESSVAVLKYTDGIETTVNLDVPATIYNGNFYIPIRAYCELWDMGIEWNNSSRSVNISSDKSYEPEADNGDVSQWLGTWYHTDYSDPQSIDDWDEVNVSYENGKYYVKKNGKVDEVVFINSNTAESVNATVYGSNDGVDINNNKLTADMHIKNAYHFEFDYYGEQTIRIYEKCVETDAMIKAEWQSGYREIPEYMYEYAVDKTVKLTEEEAKVKLETWIGDLGTWVDGKQNGLACDGIKIDNGKEYYQFRLVGLVDNHTTTLTWYVVSVDGSEIFEGWFANGYLERF